MGEELAVLNDLYTNTTIRYEELKQTVFKEEYFDVLSVIIPGFINKKYYSNIHLLSDMVNHHPHIVEYINPHKLFKSYDFDCIAWLSTYNIVLKEWIYTNIHIYSEYIDDKNRTRNNS